MHPRLADARLYAIIDTGYLGGRPVEFYAEELAAGGADIIQLRAKNSSIPEILSMARAIAPILRGRVPFIINDHTAIVSETGADGAHIGQDDGPLADGRATAGRDALLGRSTHSVRQAFAAVEEGFDYIGFGPLFATPTKPDYTPLGLSGIAEVQGGAPLPVFCIGGIKLENIQTVLDAGARRAVVVSGILQAASPSAYCSELKRALLSRPLAAHAGGLHRTAQN